MSRQKHNGEEESFYQYAMELFSEAGHVFASAPVFSNHTPEQFIYLDNKSDTSLTSDQRALLGMFDNVSQLFSANDCVFFSVNLQTARKYRSHIAHDIHTLIHLVNGADGSICIFRFDDEIMLSFIGYGKRCILSDWYPIHDDYGTLPAKLDIGNMSIQNGADYFGDMVYALARSYYFAGNDTAIYNLLPIDFFSNEEYDGIGREGLEQIAKNKLAAPQIQYGDDYVGYDDTIETIEINIGSELDLILLELNDDDDNPFGEEFEGDEFREDGLYEDADIDESERDVYEFDDVDPDIFCDPTLMVKWLAKQDGNET